MLWYDVSLPLALKIVICCVLKESAKPLTGKKKDSIVGC